MAQSRKRQPYTRRGCLKMALIPIVIFGIPIIIAIIFQIQQSMLENNVQAVVTAYQAEDCETVAELADGIIDNEEYRFNQQKTVRDRLQYCEKYLTAQTAITASNFGEGLGTYLSLLNTTYRTGNDTLNIASKIQVLFDEHEFEALQHSQSCVAVYLRTLRDIVSSDDLPEFEFLCAEFFRDAGEYPKAINNYETFLEIYPDHALAESATEAIPATLFEQSLATLESDDVTVNEYKSAIDASRSFVEDYPDNPLAKEAENNIPILILQYADALLETPNTYNYDQAIDLLSGFLVDYPEHPDFDQADALYAQILLDAGIASSTPDTTLGIFSTANTNDNPLSGASNDPSSQFERAAEFLSTFLDRYPNHPDFDTANQTLADVLYNAGIYSRDVVNDASGTVVLDYSRAIIFLTRFVERYPDDARAGDARANLDDLLKLQEELVGEIPQPDAVPIDGDETILIIQNASPYPMRISLIGSDIRQESLPACTTCETHTSAPLTCAEDGPVGTYTLRPGRYQVSVSSEGGNVQSFFGIWQLRGGFEYPNCFFIVQSNS